MCSAYWFPVYAFIRRRGHSPNDALDLTQGYFARLLERGVVAAADPARGRFRSFLLADCSFFLADSRDRDAAQKRGGGRSVLSIDARDAEGASTTSPPTLSLPSGSSTATGHWPSWPALLTGWRPKRPPPGVPCSSSSSTRSSQADCERCPMLKLAPGLE